MKQKIWMLTLLLVSLQSFSQIRKDLGTQFISDLFSDKNVNRAHELFESNIGQQITLEDLISLPKQLESQFGRYKAVLDVNNENNTYFYYTEFEKSKEDIQITFNEHNEIVGFYVLPHKIFNKEEKPDDFNINSGDIQLRGTLLIPNENNRKILVIFIHGSGPSDRNESIGENKPFKEIAEFLSKKGIASFRYDKRTYSYPETFDENSTVEQETINDVVNVSQYFKNNKNYSDYEIVLIGHSMGGYLLPEISTRTNDVSKYVFLSANARPLQDLLLEQYKYLHKLDPKSITQKELESIEIKVKHLNSHPLTGSIPKEQLPFGIPANYWKYLRDYKPLEKVKSIKKPMLFIQGGKDYQVGNTDYTLWQNTLKTYKGVIFKYYPDLNHLYFKVEGTPAPSDYFVKHNVDQHFLEDLANFIINK